MARLGSLNTGTDISTLGGGGGVALPPYSTTNVTTDRILDADAASVDELADVLGTLIIDIQAGGSGSGGTSGSTQALAETRAAAISSTIDVAVKSLRTAGYAAVGDGGDALYKRVNAQPAHAGYFRSLDRFLANGTTNSTNGGYWELVPALGGVVKVEQFGAKADYNFLTQTWTTDNSDAIEAAIGFLGLFFDPGFQYYLTGPVIEFGFGWFYCSRTVNPNRTITLRGQRGGGVQGYSSILKFPPNVGGVLARSPPTSPISPGATHTSIERMTLSGSGGTNAAAHGITMQATMSVTDCLIAGFRGNGINIQADVGFDANTNIFDLRHVAIQNSGGHGVYCQGGDANAGIGIGINSFNNAGWGIYDASFLGNTWVACHTSENGLGGYKADDDNCVSVFIGCYSENDEPASNVEYPCVVIGGFMAFGNIGSAQMMYAGHLTGHDYKSRVGDSPNITLGVRDAVDRFLAFGADSSGFKYELGYNSFYGNIIFTNQGGGTPFQITTANNTINAGRSAVLGRGKMLFPDGIWVGDVGSSTNGVRQIVHGTAAPTTGAWAQGDRVLNQAPTAGGFAGWICIAGGTPGTWKTFGAISA